MSITIKHAYSFDKQETEYSHIQPSLESRLRQEESHSSIHAHLYLDKKTFCYLKRPNMSAVHDGGSE